MNKEDYVSLECAKLLKEKGYDDECELAYETDKEPAKLVVHCMPNHRLSNTDYACPTLYEAQKWLRNVHNLCVEIYRNASGFYWSICKANYGTFITDYKLKGPNDGGCWDNYEEALNAGIYRACQMIKERKV